MQVFFWDKKKGDAPYEEASPRLTDWYNVIAKTDPGSLLYPMLQQSP